MLHRNTMLGLLVISAIFILETDAFCDGRPRIPHETQCDAYYDCTDGNPVETVCPDGLLFNPYTTSEHYYCQYPIDVDCSARPQIQPPRPTDECPHRFGYFKAGGLDRCQFYINCVDGTAHHMQCAEGLAFNPNTYTCDWPDLVDSCDPVAYLGFSCPGGSSANYKGSDCSKYYSCVNGSPRLMSCPYGSGFNPSTSTCQPDSSCAPGVIVPNYESKKPENKSAASASASASAASSQTPQSAPKKRT